MGYDHWYKQREDKLKAMKCGTKTCVSQQAKGQTSSQKSLVKNALTMYTLVSVKMGGHAGGVV